ncbi:MAG: ribosomal L7Ae/L30e/S12e/Gadd45 family protein [Acidaminococcaceae bacterium]
MKDEQGLLFALGLAQKAGKLASGDFAVKSALKGAKAKLLIVAADAAVNSKKDMYYLADISKVKVIECLTREQLGTAIGKAQRTAVAVTDNNFANMILK